MRTVARVERLLPDGRAELLVTRKSACSGDCHQCGGCEMRLLRLTADNPIGAREGENVYLESESGVVLRAAALIYLLPLLLFTAGYLSASSLGAWAFAIGALCFALGMLPAFYYNRHVSKRPPTYTVVALVK